MNALSLFQTATALGVKFATRGSRLWIKVSRPLPADLMEQLRQHKQDLIALLEAGHLDHGAQEDIREWYEERAAILEHCGKLEREAAERVAGELTKQRYRLPGGFRLH